MGQHGPLRNALPYLITFIDPFSLAFVQFHCLLPIGDCIG